MAQFDGVSKAKAEAILGGSVVSGAINGSGHLILTRQNGSTIDAGDFTGIVTAVLTDSINASLASAIPAAMAGKVVDKGSVSGQVVFTDFNKDNLVNGLLRLTATGNLTVAVGDLPATPRPNTQFAMRIQQDGTGGRTITLTGFKKSQGVLQLTPTANAIDLLVFYYDGVAWNVGMMGADLR